MSVYTDSLGALLVAVLVDYNMLGILLTMGTLYFVNFPNDRILFKMVVAVTLLIIGADSLMTAVWTYRWMVTWYGEPENLKFMPREMAGGSFTLGAMPFVAQPFFAWRVWKITEGFKIKRAFLLPMIIVVLSATQFGVFMWCLSTTTTMRLLSEESTIFPIGYAWLVCCVLADLLLSTSMTYYLVILPRKRAQGIKLHSAFVSIVIRSVETNSVTLVCQILVCILIVTPGIGAWYLICHKFATRAYCFSILVSLNTRRAGEGLGGSHPPPAIRLQHGGVTLTTVVETVVTGTEDGSPQPESTYSPNKGEVNIALNRLPVEQRTDSKNLHYGPAY